MRTSYRQQGNIWIRTWSLSFGLGLRLRFECFKIVTHFDAHTFHHFE